MLLVRNTLDVETAPILVVEIPARPGDFSDGMNPGEQGRSDRAGRSQTRDCEHYFSSQAKGEKPRRKCGDRQNGWRKRGELHSRPLEAFGQTWEGLSVLDADVVTSSS